MTFSQQILSFIQNWIPSIGVIVYALWSLFKWLHLEITRRQKEREALEANLEYNTIKLSDYKSIIMLNLYLYNKCPFPFQVDKRNTVLDIFLLSHKIPIGMLDFRSTNNIFGKQLVTIKPFIKRKSIVLEPNTKSIIQDIVVLENNFLYLVRYKVYRYTKSGKFSRTRVCICDLRKKQLLGQPDEMIDELSD